jgi:FtsX-like permease family
VLDDEADLPARETEMKAAFYWWRSTWRESLRSTLVLVALCGLLGALTLGALAGARRTETAYGRYLTSINASDVWVNIPSPDLTLIHRISTLPGVASSAAFVGLDADPIVHGHVDTDFTVDDVTGSYNGALFRQDKMTLLQGRLPGMDSSHEIALTPYLDHHYDEGIGSIVRFQLYNARDEYPVPTGRVAYRVVGIVNVPPALTDQFDEENAAVLPPAATARLRGQVQYSWVGLRLTGGSAGIPALQHNLAVLSTKTGGYPFAIRQLDEVHQQVQDAIEPEAIALAIFGLFAALALLVLVGQALGQLFDRLAPQVRVLRSLGFGRVEAVAAASASGLLGIVVGLLVAIAGAAAVSPLAPVGPVREFDPVKGFQFDVTTLIGGGALLFALLFGVLLAMAVRSVRRHGDVLHRRSLFVQWLSRSGTPVIASLGTGYALEPQPGRSRTVIWTNIIGTVVAVSAVVAAVVFGASLNGLVKNPVRYGWNWNVLMENEGGYGSYLPPTATFATFGDGDGSLDSVMSHAPGVRAWSMFGFAQMPIDGQVVPVLGVATHEGLVEPPTVSGHALTDTGPAGIVGAGAQGPSDIELGVTTLDALGEHVGGTVVVGSGIDRRRMLIVGTVTLPSIGVALSDHVSLGRGAMLAESTLMSVAGFRHLRDVPQEAFSAIPSTLAIDLVHGASQSRLVRYLGSKDLGGQSGLVYYQPRVLGAAIVDAGQMGGEPLALAIALAAAVLVSLSAAILANTRRRRREMAVLKTLGLSKAQLRGVVTWQTATVLVISIVLGVPLGIAGGHLAWVEFATTIGATPITVVPLLLLGIGVLLMLMAGVALSWVPATVAARTPTFEILSTE